jgi:pimeloyl-ACP methyl ester carboxylesterase
MTWLPVMNRLAELYRLVMPDLRGHGASAKPANGYGLEDYADDLERIVAASGEPNPILLGHSLGGLTATTWARRHPGTASAIVLEEMPLSGGQDRAPHLEWSAQLAGMPVPDVISYYRSEFPDWTEADRVRRAETVTSTHPAVFAEMVELSKRGAKIDYLAGMDAITSPTLLIHGDEATGGYIPESGAERFAALGPNFQAVRIEGGSHSLHRDSAEQFLEAVRLFLEGV